MNLSKITKSFVALAAVGIASVAQAVTVSTSAELVKALLDTAGQEAGIYLKPGFYDVSSYHMNYNPSTGMVNSSISHLAVDKQSLFGNGSKPGDVVIYGDKSETIVYMWCGSLNNLTISNGYANASADVYGGGGGVCGRNGSSRLNNIIVTDCASKNNGGGVNRAYCNGVIISNCEAANLGGGYCDDWVQMMFKDGEVKNCRAKMGGGIYGGYPVTNTIIHANTASGANGNEGWGGGAYNCKNLVDCKVYGNSATRGGGVSAATTSTDYTVNLCTISNNTATTSGGGSFRGYLKDCTIVNNTCTSYGGGVSYSTVTGGTIASNEAVGGGGADSCTVTGAIISNNVVTANGGGATSSQLYDCEVVFNLAKNTSSSQSLGGGIYNCPVVSNCTIAGNAVAYSATQNGSGGGVNGEGATLTNCRIYNNFATLGAAVENAKLVGCTVSNNVASSKFKHYTLRNIKGMTDCDLYGALIDTPRAVMSCSFKGVRASWTLPVGANVYTNGTFEANNEYLIYATQGTGNSYTNSLFAENTLNSGIFAAPNNTDTKISVVNCTFANNTCGNQFVNFQKGVHECEVINSLFYGDHTAGGESRDFHCGGAYTDGISLSCCFIGSSSQAYVTNPETFPGSYEYIVFAMNAYFDTTNKEHPYSLRYRSKARAVKNGQTYRHMLWMEDALDIRRDSKYPRLRDGYCDLGCYQCWLAPEESGGIFLVK